MGPGGARGGAVLGGRDQERERLALPVTRQLVAILVRRWKARPSGTQPEWVFASLSNPEQPLRRPDSYYRAIARHGGKSFWYHALRNCFVTVATHELKLPESLVKRLVNHRAREDVTQGYATQWTLEQLREPAQRIADRIDALIGLREEDVAAAGSGTGGSSGNGASVESHAGTVAATGRAADQIR